MDTENPVLDPYEVVLADLRAKREKIDHAIEAIQGLREQLPAGAATARPTMSQNDSPLSATSSSAFVNVWGQKPEEADLLGMTISDAAIKVLAGRRKVLGNAEIHAAFKQGGLILNSVDPLNVINSVLARRFQQVGDIVRVDRGQWGLQQWYPGRSFKKKIGKPEGDPTGDPNALELPPAPPETSVLD